MSTRWQRVWESSVFRFGLVGMLNTLAGASIMFLLYNLLHCTYWQASFANYFFGSILSFFLNKYFTFRSRKKSWQEVVRFIINIAVCYAIAYGAAKPLVRWLLSGQSLSLQDNAAMLTGMVLFMVLNYAGQRFFAFQKADD